MPFADSAVYIPGLLVDGFENDGGHGVRDFLRSEQGPVGFVELLRQLLEIPGDLLEIENQQLVKVGLQHLVKIDVVLQALVEAPSGENGPGDRGITRIAYKKQSRFFLPQRLDDRRGEVNLRDDSLVIG